MIENVLLLGFVLCSIALGIVAITAGIMGAFTLNKIQKKYPKVWKEINIDSMHMFDRSTLNSKVYKACKKYGDESLLREVRKARKWIKVGYYLSATWVILIALQQIIS